MMKLKDVMVMNLTLEELLEDLHAAERVCQKYEHKYGVLSEDFYQLFINGELDECRTEWLDWAAFYEIKQHRQQMLRERAYKEKTPKERLQSVAAEAAS